MPEKIYVTSPSLPPLDEFIPYLEKIWESKWLTNNGQFHKAFEAALAEYLGVKYELQFDLLFGICHFVRKLRHLRLFEFG